MAAEHEARCDLPVSRGLGLAPLLLRRLLRHVETGRLTIHTPSGQRVAHQGEPSGSDAVVVLHRWRALRRLLTGGRNGFAEGFLEGDWSSPDLTAVLMLGAGNAEALDRVAGGSPLLRLLGRIGHGLNRNTRAGSRRNIAFHYDIGNEFFRLWLDRSMTYSAALYDDPAATLEQAQADKLGRIADLLDLRGGETVLEIGCGWGALALGLARRGAHVTGLTLSQEQQAHAGAMMRDGGVGDRVDIRLEDYRETRGRFDRIVSIEMLEAVGERFWPTYFATLRDRLKPGGTALLQVITIDESRFEDYRSNPDFIQRYIFPGGMLPTKTILAEQSERAGLTLSTLQTFGQGYALTLAEWHRRFAVAWPAIERLGFDNRFRRIWEYYFCYCEAGFRSGVIDVGLYRLEG